MNSKPILPVIFVMLMLCVPAVAAAQANETQKSSRENKPFGVTLLGGFPGGIGVEGSLQITDRIGFSAHAGTWLVLSEVALRGRFFIVPRPESGVFVASGVHLIDATLTDILLGSGPADVHPFGISAALGWESRSRNGIIAGVEAGGIVMNNPNAGIVVLPALYFRVGRAF